MCCIVIGQDNDAGTFLWYCSNETFKRLLSEENKLISIDIPDIRLHDMQKSRRNGNHYLNNAHENIEILDNFLIPSIEIYLVMMNSFLKTIMHPIIEQKGLKLFFRKVYLKAKSNWKYMIEIFKSWYMRRIHRQTLNCQSESWNNFQKEYCFKLEKSMHERITAVVKV